MHYYPMTFSFALTNCIDL